MNTEATSDARHARVRAGASQQALVQALDEVRGALVRRAGTPETGPPREAGNTASGSGSDAARTRQDVPAGSPPTTLDLLCRTFGLSSFERAVLLLCAGMELEADFAGLCTACHGVPYPTFGLALAAFEPEAHWSALTPAAPLRHWRLVEVRPGDSLTTSPLRLDERILHYLTGLNPPDEQLDGFILPASTPPVTLVPSHRAVVEAAAQAWREVPAGRPWPVLQLCGDTGTELENLAAAVCERAGLHLRVMPVHTLPATPHEFDVLLRLWEREAILSGCALALDACTPEAEHAGRAPYLRQWLARGRTPVLLLAPEHRLPEACPPGRPLLTFFVTRPTPHEQRELWTAILGPDTAPLNGQIERLTAQFDLGETAIRAAAASAGTPPTHAPRTTGDRLWDACRRQARPRLDDLARRIEPVATWDDLVLPERPLQTLRTIALHVRHRLQVYETWGFARKSRRGLGISALFTGPSGTGKTMAAEVLAGELRLDLYRIDLSQVVSKYIGETEKNLRRVFDAAEAGGAILLFDEADALFGKRTEVKDSHDRYANIEVSYLLQRMEAYRGLAILTTNLKDALDDAFQRRIRFIVTFPFPDAALRLRIWERIFPGETPTRGLDAGKLARLTLTGGNIRNIALNAAFLAAGAGEPVEMKHLLEATRQEYAKLDKPLTEAETRGWI
ncbi:ATP-binding protein [Rhodocaloribacter litoris]|uniref:ATP-binding protein n=1 Tax=Rhodocaloribacter litoris TaxID=2558931 RepID=UPI00141F83C1|nr:ATP-binding protein [Rhodocaloribacter litoris]QXD15736.1 ATP-binding protein [Rhodocaloribacter litoris]